MRKVLASFLATAMVASMAATSAFALQGVSEKPNAPATTAIASGDFKAGTTDVDGVRLWVHDGDADDAYYDVSLKSAVDISTVSGIPDLMKAMKGLKFDDVDVDGEVYTVTLTYASASGGKIGAEFSPASKFKRGTAPTLSLEFYNGSTNVSASIKSLAAVSDNLTKDYEIDNERSGDFNNKNYHISDLVVAYSDGTPIPLTEKGVGVDKDLNNEGGIQSGSTLYFMLKTDKVPKLDDDSYWKIKTTKGDNGKYIKAVTDVTKKFSNNLYDANSGRQVEGTGGDRHRYVKVELNDIYTDDEYKITLDMRISAKSNAVDTLGADDDTEIKVNDFYFYLKNIVKNADNDWKVGIGGLMLNPLQNDWNDVVYFDEDGDVAHMKFFADSDTGKFFAKLSTKWEHADYASYFNDQDAYIFDFVGSPKLSSTSRADLEIYNPFVDEDGNETIDPSTAVIYQVIDGDLYDVTDSFSYDEGENGDMAFITRTRFLGTYIICEKAVEEATDNTNTPDELVPEAPVDQAPVETPSNNNGGKAPANTGRYA